MLFHKNGHISANYGPILKIQNLAYSGERARPFRSIHEVARDAIRDTVARDCRPTVDS